MAMEPGAVEFELVFVRGQGFERLPLPPAPIPTGSQVVVRPKWVGICGSDLYLMETIEEALRLGHEWVGLVESCGDGVTSLKPGDSVTSTATWGCQACVECSRGKTNLCSQPVFLSSPEMGALRSWLVVHAGNLVRLQAEASDQALHEVIAVAEEAVRLMEENLPEGADPAAEVLVLGCGPVGLLTALVLRERGYRPTVVERHLSRIEAAKSRGLAAISYAQALLDPALKNHFALALDATSNFDGSRGGLEAVPLFVKREFLLVMVGKYVKLPEVPRAFFRMAGKVVWMRGMGKPVLEESVKRWDPHLEQLARGVVTQIFPSTQVAEAFESARRQDGQLKVLIEV